MSTLPGGIELDQHVGAFIDRPDVVLRVHAHRMREREAVVVAADLAHEHALRRVLEEPRLVGAVIDVDRALRARRDPHVLAGVDARRVLEEVGHGFVRDHRDAGRRGPRLGRERTRRWPGRDRKHAGDEGPQSAASHGCVGGIIALALARRAPSYGIDRTPGNIPADAVIWSRRDESPPPLDAGLVRAHACADDADAERGAGVARGQRRARP